MNPYIVSAIITGVSTIVGVVLTNEFQLRRQTRQLQPQQQQDAEAVKETS